MSTAKITPSLLNSFTYFMALPEDYKPRDLSMEEYQEKARKDFLDTLTGAERTMHQNVQKGIQFEEDVRNRILTGVPYENKRRAAYSETVNAVADLLGPFTIWNKYFQHRIKVGKREVMLSGEVDAISGDTMWDLKLTGSYALGKFVPTWQHIIYPICMRSDLYKPTKFSYVITNPSGSSWWREDYFYHEGFNRHLEDGITGFLSWLKNDPELEAAYWDEFCKGVA